MDAVGKYQDLEGRRATTYLLWRRALSEFQSDKDGSRFLETIAVVTGELRAIREEAVEAVAGMPQREADVARRLEEMEDQHLRDMVAHQQSIVQGGAGQALAISQLEEEISDLLQELTPDGD